MTRRRKPDPGPSAIAPAAADEEISALARRYRRESIATLIAVSRNSRAPASARAAAAAKVLEYSDGRPAQARQVTVSDLTIMSPDQRQELLHALLIQYETEMPGVFKAMMTEAYNEALHKVTASPKPPRFTRGPPRQRLPHQPQREPSATAPPRSGASAEVSSPIVARGDGIATGEQPQPVPPPDNVVPLPRGTHPAIVLPPPASSDCAGAAGSVPAGGAHPSVLARSALPGQLALDRSLRDYQLHDRCPWWRQ